MAVLDGWPSLGEGSHGHLGVASWDAGGFEMLQSMCEAEWCPAGQEALPTDAHSASHSRGAAALQRGGHSHLQHRLLEMPHLSLLMLQKSGIAAAEAAIAAQPRQLAPVSEAGLHAAQLAAPAPG